MTDNRLQERVRAFAKRLEREDVNMHGFLLTVDGEQKAQAYYAPFREGEPHRLYSVSKTMTGLAISLHFDGSGALASTANQQTSEYVTTLTTPPYTALASGDNTKFDLSLALTGNGASTVQTVSIRFPGGTVTQYDSSSGSTIHYNTNDGYTYGSLSEVTIDNRGIVTGVFSNSQRQQLAQIAVYQFNNFSGLNKTGNSFYQPSNNSGEPQRGTVLSLGVTLTASALEMSNVDVADQFSDMIITQRGFQSNSKIVTVSDEMLETLINMKR